MCTMSSSDIVEAAIASELLHPLLTVDRVISHNSNISANCTNKNRNSKKNRNSHNNNNIDRNSGGSNSSSNFHMCSDDEIRRISNGIRRDVMEGIINSSRSCCSSSNGARRRLESPLPLTSSSTSGETRADIISRLASAKEPTYVVTGNNGAALVDRILSNLGWKRLSDKSSDQFKLKWVEVKSSIHYESLRDGEQMVNRIPNCYLLTNKLGLLTSLRRYEHVWKSLNLNPVVKLHLEDFVPQTFRLDDATEQKTFINTFKHGEMWICKPMGLNQGRGIYLVRSLDDLNEESDCTEQKDRETGQQKPLPNRIVQRYIMNPLLLEGRKFDIRVYMLVSSTVPFVVFYHKGYARLCLKEYHNGHQNLVVHLTNQFIQRKDAGYEANKEKTVWSFDKLNEYINENYAKVKNIETDWVYKTLKVRMKKIMLYCFHAVKHKLKAKLGFFDLYGFDFLVDEDMKVWLIEVNANPCLATNCSVLKEVVSSVVAESVHLAVECFEKSRRGQTLFPLECQFQSELLYNGGFSMPASTHYTPSAHMSSIQMSALACRRLCDCSDIATTTRTMTCATDRQRTSCNEASAVSHELTETSQSLADVIDESETNETTESEKKADPVSMFDVRSSSNPSPLSPCPLLTSPSCAIARKSPASSVEAGSYGTAAAATAAADGAKSRNSSSVCHWSPRPSPMHLLEQRLAKSQESVTTRPQINRPPGGCDSTVNRQQERDFGTTANMLSNSTSVNYADGRKMIGAATSSVSTRQAPVTQCRCNYAQEVAAASVEYRNFTSDPADSRLYSPYASMLRHYSPRVTMNFSTTVNDHRQKASLSSPSQIASRLVGIVSDAGLPSMMASSMKDKRIHGEVIEGPRTDDVRITSWPRVFETLSMTSSPNQVDCRLPELGNRAGRMLSNFDTDLPSRSLLSYATNEAAASSAKSFQTAASQTEKKVKRIGKHPDHPAAAQAT